MKGAAKINAEKTHCNHGHEFTPENTYWAPGDRRRRCRSCMRARDARWRSNNPEKAVAKTLRWRKKNPEKAREYSRRSYSKNRGRELELRRLRRARMGEREKRRARHRRWRTKNPERAREFVRRSIAKNPEKYRDGNRRRYENKKFMRTMAAIVAASHQKESE